MRIKRSRFALAGVLALALGVFAGPGVAQAKKVTETAAGGTLPAAGGVVDGEFVQTFELKGKKVKKKQTTDVEVTVNGTDAGGNFNGVSAVLSGPRGDSFALPLPFGAPVVQYVNLTFDSQSKLVSCDPAVRTASNCNYVTGGVQTGLLNAGLNPVFKGVNPKGTWTLNWYNTLGNTVTIGESTLEVNAGKKFAKEDK